MDHQHTPEILATSTKVVNGVSVYVAGTSILGIVDWQLWVYVLTAIFISVQMVTFIYKHWVKPWFKRGE